MYLALESGNLASLASNGYKFISQYMALEQHAVSKDAEDTHTWRVRAKFHLLQHILAQACEGCHLFCVWFALLFLAGLRT